MKRAIEEKAEEVYNMFNKELRMVSKKLNQNTSLPDHIPCLSGQAHWMRALKHRLERPMEVTSLDYTGTFSFSPGTYWLPQAIRLTQLLPPLLPFSCPPDASEGPLHA